MVAHSGVKTLSNLDVNLSATEVINSTVVIRLSSPAKDVTPTSVEESSDDCKPKNLRLVVCIVLYLLISL